MFGNGNVGSSRRGQGMERKLIIETRELSFVQAWHQEKGTIASFIEFM